ncbi:UNVERIFIED_ORG: hypothetical protein EC838_0391, partial [Providencia alcalifaciens]
MNKIVSMNGANVQFSDILTRWMTEQGIITVTLPDQTIQQLRTTKEMDKQLDGKFDKAGGTVTGPTTFNHTNIRVNGTNDWTSLRLVKQDGSYAMIQTNPASDTAMLSITNRDKDEKTLGLVSIPNRSGTAMLVGDYGIGVIDGIAIPDKDYNNIQRSGFYAGPGGAADVLNPPPKSSQGDPLYGGIIMASRSAQEGFLITAHNNEISFRSRTSSVWRNYQRFYTTANTIKDAQGNLRAASPIIKVFADHIDPNEEAEGVVLEKLGVGRYKLKGVLGMNSDASWGGFNGGIVIPKGINGLELVWADYKVLADGDIILETHYRKHADLPPPVVLNRLIAYPEFMDENGNELESYTPCDIPNGHWIDIRVQMPNDSIYNQKQAEAERLAK